MATIRTVGIGDLKDVGIIYGGELMGFSTMHGLKALDTLRPEGFMGQPLSFWGDLLGAVGGAVGALYLDAPYSLLSALVGGYLATDLVTHMARITKPPPDIPTPPEIVARSRLIVTPSVAAKGRYVVVT